MRKQYYFRPSDRGLLAWDVDRAVPSAGRTLPILAHGVQEHHEPAHHERHDRPLDGQPPEVQCDAVHLRFSPRRREDETVGERHFLVETGRGRDRLAPWREEPEQREEGQSERHDTLLVAVHCGSEKLSLPDRAATPACRTPAPRCRKNDLVP